MKRFRAIAGILASFALLPRGVQAQASMEAATAAFQDDVHADAGIACIACPTTRAPRCAPRVIAMRRT